ncbi:MAG: hypothetical protein WKH64_04325 [Chloroflexia bacterium]
MEGKTVLDAYCGGVHALHRRAGRANDRHRGIAHGCAADARENLAGLEVQVVEGRAEDELSALGPAVDLVLLDPPRAGVRRRRSTVCSPSRPRGWST